VTVNKGSNGDGVFRGEAGTAVICPFGHKEFCSCWWKAVSQPPGIIEREILILLPVNNQNWYIDFGSKADRINPVHPELVKDVQPENDSGSE
jgi:hypothetical protein